MRPRYVPAGADGINADAELWIGDQALEYRRKNPGVQLMDLGLEWKKHTGLPFVFALWSLSPELSNAREIAALLRRAQILGLAQRARLARTADQFKYLMEHIRYEVHVAEKQALDLFGEHLMTLGEIKQKPHLNWI
jgi:predicted solute-binding protein